MSRNAHFGPQLFEFMAELRLNNNREWFQANKARYESDVLHHLRDFVADFGEPLKDISGHMVADPRPSGGSVFRIYRDVRFSKDKTPYKTHAAAQFRHEAGKEVHGPGYYVHLEPGNVIGGAGMWHPETKTLGQVRDAISSYPVRWQRVVGNDAFKASFQLQGDSLKSPPRGYDPEHPLIDDLKRKDYLVSKTFTEEEATSPDFIDRFTQVCRDSAPLMEFLTTAVGLPW